MILSKLSISLSLLLLIAAVTAEPGVKPKTCKYDSECGGAPYNFCSGGADDCIQIFEGVAVSDGKVFYAEGCRAPDVPYAVNGQKVNATLKSANINNGQITNYYTEQRQRSGTIGGVWAINGKNLYINRYNPRYQSLNTFNLDTKKETTLYTKFYDEFYLTSTASYTCLFKGYGADDDYKKYWNVVKYTGSSTTPQVLYTIFAGGCDAVYVSGSTIYFAASYFAADNVTQVSTVYKGDANCNNCQVSPPLFTVDGSIGGFTQDSSDATKLYFGTEKGLFFWGSNKKVTSVSADAVYGVISFYQGSIYYNNEKSVRGYNVNTKRTKDVNTKKVGVCTCAPGFKYTNNGCVCSGQIQFDNYKNPTCVPTDANGVPQSCTADYQCGNAPYTVCSYDSTCTCQPNFTGPKCDKCAGTATVGEDGVPVCTVSA